MKKALFRYTAVGIGIAAFISMCFSAIAGLAMGGDTGRMLARQFIVMLAVGVGYGAPAIVWLNERMATWAKLAIALVPGTVIYTFAAWWMGWIPRQYGIWAVLSFIAIMLVLTLIISIICGYVFRGDVRKMNAQLKRRQQE